MEQERAAAGGGSPARNGGAEAPPRGLADGRRDEPQKNEAGSVPAGEPRRREAGEDVLAPPTQAGRPGVFPPNAPGVHVALNPITNLVEPVLAMTEGNSTNPGGLRKSLVGAGGPGDWQHAGVEPGRSNGIQITHKDAIQHHVPITAVALNPITNLIAPVPADDGRKPAR
ncbi:hypothetical protein THAOC_18989 [Thalassiosira oceanica]|uniref:Uncharacterized protein n=1 Tax=Thalassiosira oceanica TaxID=159749 RepID=K0S6U3_THAOC|nr:hypothetical protein THAOC_18989 [Thalassiosira oceanica]|eukprot:EJK60619.1 hypothetical protein THAOC_18989 [Thalassiosira oceanica]